MKMLEEQEAKIAKREALLEKKLATINQMKKYKEEMKAMQSGGLDDMF